MNEFQLKYGCNPNQKPARIYMADGSELPVEILNGRPGYINFLDAFNSWQLVKEVKEATGMVAATSFKHVSPTSAAVGKKLSEALKKSCFVDDIEGLDDSPLACAYARARGTDRMSSFGDWIALSDECDEVTAKLIAREVSDGVIAPAYTPKALEILKTKRKGGYNIVKIDPAYVPAEIERKQVFGVTFEQGRNNFKIDRALLENIVTKNKNLPEDKAIDLIIHKGKVGEVYNVGGHNEMQNIDIVKLICKELGKPESLITHVSDRKGHDMRYAIDPAKIHAELGWLPETKFQDGIKKTIRWYLDNKDWWQEIVSGEYQNYYQKMYGDRK